MIKALIIVFTTIQIFAIPNDPQIQVVVPQLNLNSSFYSKEKSASGVCCSEDQLQHTEATVDNTYGVEEAKITGITFSSASEHIRTVGSIPQNGYSAFFHSITDKEITLRIRRYQDSIPLAPRDVYREGVFPTGIKQVNGKRFLSFTHQVVRPGETRIGTALDVDSDGFITFKIIDSKGTIGAKFRIILTDDDTVAKIIRKTYRPTNSPYTESEVASKLSWSAIDKRKICLKVNNVYKANDGLYCVNYLLNRGNKID
ncbi:MAG: Unknown protein [uncultured Sulfurovum sp.]|uniref:Uncharacterized protein n=1 Tax=uncultured Sulfurovum sp. TaxID=269237 RepID=A0A6S6SPL8_9BACT|nr:MAG: Unknown protein [uncultured Sulfurovum sp.]